MKKPSVVLVGVLMMIVSFQPAQAQKEKFHSIFIYNFSKYVKWPDAQSSGTFVIGVLGTSAIQKELQAMANTKKVNGMSIEIKQFTSVANIGDCHILYISSSENKEFDKVLSKTNNKSVLIVTDHPGMAKKGSAINFVEVDGKIKFELNQQKYPNKRIEGCRFVD